MKNLKLLAVLILLISNLAIAKGRGDNPCKQDRKSFCSSCERGDRTCVKTCMKTNKDNLSQECQEFRAQRRASRQSGRKNNTDQ